MYGLAVRVSVAWDQAIMFLSHPSRYLHAQVPATNLSVKVKVLKAQRLVTVAHMPVVVPMASNTSAKTAYGRCDRLLQSRSPVVRGAGHQLFLPLPAWLTRPQFHPCLATSSVLAASGTDTSSRQPQHILLTVRSTLPQVRLALWTLSLHP